MDTFPRGYLPAGLPAGPIVAARRSLGDEAVREALAEGEQPPITPSSGVRIEHELRYWIASATAVQAPSDRSRFQRTQAYSREHALALASNQLRQQRRIDHRLLASPKNAEDARRVARMSNKVRRALPLPRYFKPLRAETS